MWAFVFCFIMEEWEMSLVYEWDSINSISKVSDDWIKDLEFNTHLY